jgi:Phosphoglucomutase/phosphomannomutase, alpha/beta/alpha domain III
LLATASRSGHILLLDHATTGDGVLTALHLLARVAATGSSLAELASVVRRLPQVLVNVTGVDKARVDSAEDLRKAVAEAEGELGRVPAGLSCRALVAQHPDVGAGMRRGRRESIRCQGCAERREESARGSGRFAEGRWPAWPMPPWRHRRKKAATCGAITLHCRAAARPATKKNQ